MQKNYVPWEVRVGDFFLLQSDAERLKFILNFAILAPSSHNSQPWRFRLDDSSISVFVEPSRRLVASDTNDRQLFISLGCAITNILVAADYYGYVTDIQFLPDAKDGDYAARIVFKKGVAKTGSADHLICAISQRVNNRNPYAVRLPDAVFLGKIRALGSETVQVAVITDAAIKDALADAALEAGVAAMEDVSFREELSRYVKTNVTRSGFGMPAFGMGISTPVSLFVPFLIRRFNMNRVNRKKDERVLKQFTPAFVVIATKADTKESWLRTGELYECIALMATQEGMTTGVWAAPIQIGEYYKGFQAILKTDFRPQMFFRLGYPLKDMRHSPRLLVKEVTR